MLLKTKRQGVSDMEKKEYNKLRNDIYNLSLFVAEIKSLEGKFPLILEEANTILKEKTSEIEEGLKKLRGDNNGTI